MEKTGDRSGGAGDSTQTFSRAEGSGRAGDTELKEKALEESPQPVPPNTGWLLLSPCPRGDSKDPRRCRAHVLQVTARGGGQQLPRGGFQHKALGRSRAQGEGVAGLGWVLGAEPAPAHHHHVFPHSRGTLGSKRLRSGTKAAIRAQRLLSSAAQECPGAAALPLPTPGVSTQTLQSLSRREGAGITSAPGNAAV